MTHPLHDSSSRVALAAYLHDLGKFAERAGAFDADSRLAANLTLYCPFHRDGGWFSHRHAAHTALAFDLIERHLPELLGGDPHPFAGFTRAGASTEIEPTDSLINASAAHHKPDTFLQWIVATADRVASGFEREEFERYNTGKDETRAGLDHYTSRQLTLFEQLRLSGDDAPETSLEWRYPLKPLAPRHIFPVAARVCERRDRVLAKQEYRALWDAFVDALEAIPRSHRGNPPLWLDHFDSLWLTYTHAIPAATAFNVRPEVSLYDHSRTSAALAVALWRWHESSGQVGADAAIRMKARADFAEQKFLLIQGDFFGIQEFVFATGGETRRQAAKLLRGRSFQVSLFTEVAALRILDELGLPPTSQVINAAGKFLIVAPDTPDVLSAIERIRRDLDQWFLDHAFGQAGIGIAWLPASCDDFLRKAGEASDRTPFARLMQRLHDSLDWAKYHRLDICTTGARVFDRDFPHGPCGYNGRLPADQPERGDGPPSCALSRDQIAIGEAVVGLDRLLVVRGDSAEQLREGAKLRRLELQLFGYALGFTAAAEVTGRFGEIAASGALRRCWDYSLPVAGDSDGTAPLWTGYARRFISGHVPYVGEVDLSAAMRDRYVGVREDERPGVAELKTLDMIACEDRRPDDSSSKWLGVAALGVLKGDIDDLGELFRVGLKQPSFAKWAALSRQVNGFFAIYLPWLLAREFGSVYTVFAGGDDFFLIGPWRTAQRLAARMREEFAAYVAGNAGIHFSVGIATQKPGVPIHSLAELAEYALAAAKSREGKNSVTCFGQTVRWAHWQDLENALARLGELRAHAQLSTGYVYGLLQFVEMRRQEQEEGKAEAAMWRSRLAYRTRRFVVDRRRKLDEAGKRALHTLLVEDIGNAGIERIGPSYQVVLFNHLYQFRDR